MRKPFFCVCFFFFFFFAYAKTKTQISFAVIAKLICVFVFATRIVHSLFFLDPKFQASSHLLSLYSLVCVGPGRKPRRPVFSQRGLYDAAYPKHQEQEETPPNGNHKLTSDRKQKNQLSLLQPR